MKRFIFGAMLLAVIVAPAAVTHAQTSSTTPMVGSHRKPYVAGFVDSINNKGAWLLSNYPITRLIYISENPEFRPLWIQAMKTLYGIEVK